jgi:hypothetical protein
MRLKQYSPKYIAYINSLEWQCKRREAINRARGQYERCGSMQRLQVHHKTYCRLGHELPEDLEVLCRLCHELEHPRLAKRNYVVVAQPRSKRKPRYASPEERERRLAERRAKRANR